MWYIGRGKLNYGQWRFAPKDTTNISQNKLSRRPGTLKSTKIWGTGLDKKPLDLPTGK